MSDLREYGLGDIKIEGVPRFKEFAKDKVPACPHCGCTHVAVVEVDVIDQRLRGERGLGTYLSCVACPWAGPMACISLAAVAAAAKGDA